MLVADARTPTSTKPAALPVEPSWGPTGPSGSILVCLGGDHVRVVLRGEIDVSCAEQAAHALHVVAEVGGRVVVDARRVTFLDASALTLLIRLRRAATSWCLQEPAERVVRMLQLTDLTHLLAEDEPRAAGARASTSR